MRRRVLITWCAGAPLIGVAALWAFVPVSDGDQRTIRIAQPHVPDTNEPDQPSPAVDPDVYAVSIWNPPPAPRGTPQPLAVAKRPKPPVFQLVAIIEEEGGRRAALYDPKNDRMLFVGSGDRIERYTVTAIESDAVELSDGQSTSRLLLRKDGS